MSTLTREMIVKRTQNYNLNSITQLNMWGQYLQNISIIREMTSLESVTFSKNQIKTLKDFQNLINLKQLSLQDNLISDFRELKYLSSCTRLRELWLGQNPISSKPGYRYIVIGYLPFLSKLDNVEVNDEDREGASQIQEFENRENKQKNNFNNDYYYERNNKINYHMNNIYENRNYRPQSQERNAGVMSSISFLLKDMNKEELEYILKQIDKKIEKL